MKKILLFLGLITMSVFLIVSVTSNAAALPVDAPVIGVESTTTDFYSHWQPGNFGANRVGDTGVAMALTSGFGLRAGFRTPYDLTDFEVQYDLTYINPGVAFITFFGPQGSYIGGNGATLSIEFVKHTTEANKYLIAINKGTSAHNESFSEFIIAEHGIWEDSAWKGFIVTAPNDLITISMVDDGTNTVVTINGTPVSIASSKLFADVVDKTNAYYLVGAINQDGSTQTAISNYIFDAARRTYYETDGVYMTFKDNLTDLEAALLEDLSVTANVQAAQALRNAMDIDLLYSYDKTFYQTRFDTAVATLDAAVLELGGDIVLDGYETEVVKLETAANAIVGYTTANAALTLQTSTDAKLIDIDDTDFSVDQNTRFTTLQGRVETARTLVATKIKDLVDSQVQAYVDSVVDLTTIENVNAALAASQAISSNLIQLLEEADQTSVNASITASDAAIEAATQTLLGWTINEDTYVVADGDSISATFLGGAFDDGNGIFYGDETFDVRNFSMVLDIQSITSTTGGWFSFGLMEKQEVFSNADDSSVQDNKGLFFLFIPEGANGARVEIYQMSLYSNRFFDAIKQEVLHVDLLNDVVISFTTEMRTVSGVVEEYMVISIGGDTMDSETITTRAMKTSLIDYTGYLYLAGSGATAQSPNTVTIKSINSVSPVADVLVTSYLPEPMLATVSSNYTLEASQDVNVSFYSRSLDLSVKLNGQVVSTDNYTYENNLLKLKAAYLETLTVGENEFTIETAGGATVFTLTVAAAAVEPVVEEPGMSTGLIVAIVAASALAIGGAVFFVIKKRIIKL